MEEFRVFLKVCFERFLRKIDRMIDHMYFLYIGHRIKVYVKCDIGLLLYVVFRCLVFATKFI